MVVYEALMTTREVLLLLATGGSYLLTNNVLAPFAAGVVSELVLCYYQRTAFRVRVMYLYLYDVERCFHA